MCIKIISSESEFEFNPHISLESQAYNAKEILIKYEPLESEKIQTFLNQLENMVKTGVSFSADIKVTTNNLLDGIRLDRKVEQLKQKLEVNEVIKNISFLHENTDKKLKEISKTCLEIENMLVE